MQTPRRLARWVPSSLTPQRVERGWRAIAARLPPGRRPTPWWRVALIVTLAATATIVGLRARFGAKAPGALDGAVLETAADQQQSLTLADGSSITLEASTRLRLVRVSGKDVRLELEHGAVEARVVHTAGRAFTVSAADVEVVDEGTHFRVAHPGDGSVEVRVVEGSVQIARRDGSGPARMLGAGETWTTELGAGETRTTEPDALGATTDEPPPATPPTEPAPRSSPASFARNAPARLPKRFHALYESGEYGEAYDSLGPHELDTLVANVTSADLFAIAEVARLSGHPKHAAMAFDALRTAHRADPRAGLAALELGRLRLIDLDDPGGAAEAFRDAVTLQTDEGFREDAQARLVQALDASGDIEACAAAKRTYVERHPDGLHAAAVGRSCRPR